MILFISKAVAQQNALIDLNECGKSS